MNDEQQNRVLLFGASQGAGIFEMGSRDAIKYVLKRQGGYSVHFCYLVKND